MLTIFSAGLKKLDFGRVIPFNDDDLLYMIDKNTALRISNISTDKGAMFTVKYIMETSETTTSSGSMKRKVFGSKLFEERIKEFNAILETRLERYFDTQKSEYIFFDKEEQEFLSKDVFSKLSMSGIVFVYVRTDEGFGEVDLLDLDIKTARAVISNLNKLKIRALMKASDYYDANKIIRDRINGARRKFKKKELKMKVDRMKGFFIRYPKLSEFKTSSDVDKYFKFLKRKYHPDKETGNHDIFVIINDDHKDIQNTSWYNSLQ